MPEPHGATILRDHAAFLDTLALAEPAQLKALANDLLPELGPVEVLQSRTGLVMQPMRDTVTEVDFHLGEVLVAEAHLRLTEHAVEGYGMTIGRDLERSMAMALLDAARAAGLCGDRLQCFVADQAAAQERADAERLRRIEATRVDMETF